MNTFQEREQKRRRSFWQRLWAHRNEYLALLLALAALAWLHAEHRRDIETLQAEAQHAANMERLLSCLRVPSEALYTDTATMEKINELRCQAYRRCGAERVLTYEQVLRSGEESVDSIIDRKDGGLRWQKTWLVFDPAEGNPTDDPCMLGGATIEGYWQYRGFGARLAEELRQNTGLGRHLNKHKDEFDGRIRPLVLRLLGSCHPQLRLDGCAILLAAGERSAEIIGILAEYARQPDVEQEAQINGHSVRQPFPSKEKERALRLAREHGLELGP
jgi:hypothetical protein